MIRTRCFVCNKVIGAVQPVILVGRFVMCLPCHEKGGKKKPSKKPHP